MDDVENVRPEYRVYLVGNGERTETYRSWDRDQCERVACVAVSDHGAERVEIDNPAGVLVFVYDQLDLAIARQRFAAIQAARREGLDREERP